VGYIKLFREMRNAQKILVQELEGKSNFWRLGRKWEGNNKMDLKGISYESELA
jgi:hypothetical protein